MRWCTISARKKCTALHAGAALRARAQPCGRAQLCARASVRPAAHACGTIAHASLCPNKEARGRESFDPLSSSSPPPPPSSPLTSRVGGRKEISCAAACDSSLRPAVWAAQRSSDRRPSPRCRRNLPASAPSQAVVPNSLIWLSINFSNLSIS